ncbi:hypothetical protein [Devosia sediminis]|uniref:Uncharacterized protein n=1 Tax=Devosia sediminis TaxID=2798801 RepID=A0A934MKS2_9HYPH|nr:hypothetical protein [Devosia sediminis]MBJ3785448.1 hypothetical protein [Devosia sediminis]
MPLRGIERFISFGGICGVIGVVCDLMAPVGSYTLWALGGGAAILLLGLVLATVRSFRDQVVQAMTAFGLLLVTVSIGFLALAPENDRGVLATEFAWIGSAQNQLLGIEEAVVQIAADTAKVVDNTADIAETSSQIVENTSDIADTNSQIASDAELVRHLSFSMNGFLEALYSQDQLNIRAYCDRGYRLYQTAFLFREDRSQPQLSERNYQLLSELDCYDTAQICDSSTWSGLTSLDPRRVAEQCGAAGVEAMAQFAVRREQAVVDRVKRQEECEAKLIADYGEENGRRLASSCRSYF